MTDKIVRPRVIYLGSGGTNEKLYRLEAKRKGVIERCANELAKILNHREQDYWEETMPQALYDVLESYSPNTVAVVCKAWLEDHPQAKQFADQLLDVPTSRSETESRDHAWACRICMGGNGPVCALCFEDADGSRMHWEKTGERIGRLVNTPGSDARKAQEKDR